MSVLWNCLPIEIRWQDDSSGKVFQWLTFWMKLRTSNSKIFFDNFTIFQTFNVFPTFYINNKFTAIFARSWHLSYPKPHLTQPTPSRPISVNAYLHSILPNRWSSSGTTNCMKCKGNTLKLPYRKRDSNFASVMLHYRCGVCKYSS